MEYLQMLQYLDSNVFSVNIIIALLAIGIAILYTYSGTTKNLPPGPVGLPILGYLPFLGKNSHDTFNKLAEKYGNVFSLYFGNRLVIVLNNYEAIKEAYGKQGEVFSGRPALQLTFADTDKYGVSFADGDIWTVHRRFALNVLKDLGVGKLSMEPQIMDEIQSFGNELKKLNGRPTNFSELLTASVSNNVCILLFGKRFDYMDPWLISAKLRINELSQVASSVGVVNFFPWLLKIPGIGKIVKQEAFIKLTKEFKASVYSRIAEFKKHHTDGQRDCYINAFIEEQAVHQKKDKSDMMFSDKALEENIRNLMATGTESTSNTLLWCILYMVKHPAVQRSVQKEIDDIVGTERTPCWNDRLRTPYTEATINEVMRMSTLLPIGVPHKNVKDCELFGYTIPKGTFIVSNLWAVHNDDKLWKNPKDFRPERFLAANGEVQKSEHLIPFSVGKRDCLGISLAKMELYLYFTALLQNFTFKGQEGSTPSLEPRKGFTYGPKYFNIRAVMRVPA